VVTYNLYWWCVSDEYGNCPQNADGKGFQGIYNRLQQNGPFDLIGFQECDDVGKIISGSGLATSFEYYTPAKGNDAAMAWQHEKFRAIEGPGVHWVARDKYGDRNVNWVRLQVVGSNTVIFFANTHGPLDQCGGKPGKTVAANYLSAVNQHKKPGDVVVFTGDFNCGSNQDTMKALSQACRAGATDKSYGGADHIFSTEGVAVLWHGYSDLESKSRWEVFARAFKFLGDTGHPILKRTFEGLMHLQSLYGYTSEFLGVAPLLEAMLHFFRCEA
ncbi:unnamed protein product, partial [Effrenium voratum]